jgi:hypothetical protein
MDRLDILLNNHHRNIKMVNGFENIVNYFMIHNIKKTVNYITMILMYIKIILNYVKIMVNFYNYKKWDII